jgi:hypothetical protein
MYIVKVKNNYKDVSFYENDNEIKLENVDAFQKKLFDNDFFLINNDNSDDITIVDSPIRKKTQIPGVLLLNKNKTYGRSKKGKLLYRCIPYNKNLPEFLISYEMKNISFSKVFTSLYVNFVFIEWNEKHPLGMLTQVIGSVDEIKCFYDYYMYSKDLYFSLTNFKKQVENVLKLKPSYAIIENQENNKLIFEKIMKNEKYKIDEERKAPDWFIFTIDSLNTSDYDDAFSWRDFGDKQLLSIYISNVALYLDYLDLWDYLTERVATIYLSGFDGFDNNILMLPSFLSQILCSLRHNTSCFAFTMDIWIEKREICKVEFKNCKIDVSQNFGYEVQKLVKHPNYISIMDFSLSIQNKYREVEIKNSHDLVEFWMIFMNSSCAKELLKNKTGIFRYIPPYNPRVLNSPPGDNISPGGESAFHFSVHWKHMPAEYFCDLKRIPTDEKMYTHITSPLRRFVDILNLVQLQKSLGLVVFNDKTESIYNKWISKIDVLNDRMRSIKKLQTKSRLFYIFDSNKKNNSYAAYLFDKRVASDHGQKGATAPQTATIYKYNAYIPELSLTSTLKTTENISDDYEKRKVELFFFKDEYDINKKIKIQLIL